MPQPDQVWHQPEDKLMIKKQSYCSEDTPSTCCVKQDASKAFMLSKVDLSPVIQGLCHAGGASADGEQPKLFGVDCEMCITAEGFELTRVSLVNERLEVTSDARAVMSCTA